LKGIISKSSNVSYKPWKNKFAPKNPHSPFGDFPKDFQVKRADSAVKKGSHIEENAKKSFSVGK
jgi:hypothetical protein